MNSSRNRLLLPGDVLLPSGEVSTMIVAFGALRCSLKMMSSIVYAASLQLDTLFTTS